MTYTLTTGSNVIRDADHAHIPADLANVDWQQYQTWVGAGNTPNPASPPTKAKQAADWLAGGLTVTSQSNPSLNGLYSVTGPDNLNINAAVTAAANGTGLPLGLSQMAVFDMSGVQHMFKTHELAQLSVAMRDFVHNSRNFALGQGSSLPPKAVTLVSPPLVYPACSVYQRTAQSIPSGTATKILFDTVEYDTTSAFDPVNARFKPAVGGYYQISCGCGLTAGSVQNCASIYKNGVEFRRGTTSSEGANTRLSTLVHLNGTTDYAEGFVLANKSFSTVTGGVMTSFSAVLVQTDIAGG